MGILRKIKKSRQLKNVLKISGGTISGQIISIVTLPLITRIYGAEIMGIWTTIVAVALIVQSVSELGLTSSLMVEEDEEKLTKIYGVISTISLVISILTIVVFFPYFYCIKKFSLFNSLVYSIFGIIYAFTVKQVNTCYTWLNREKKYNILMKNPVINYSVMGIFSLILGLVGFRDYGYFCGVVLGQFITLLHMKRQLPKSFLHFDRKDYFWVVNKYVDFIKYQLPNNFMFQFREQLPNLLIGILFGDNILGYYSVSLRILNLPVNFIGQAIGKVFYQSVSAMKRSGQDIGSFVYRNINRAIYIAIVPILGLYTIGDIFAVIFFGNEYVIAGTILRIVVFKMFFSFISTSTQGLEIVLQKQQYSVMTTLFQTLSSCASIAIGFYINKSIEVSLILMVFTFILVQLIFYKKMYQVMKLKIAPQIALMIVIFLGVIIFGGIMRFGIEELIEIFEIRTLEWFKW